MRRRCGIVYLGDEVDEGAGTDVLCVIAAPKVPGDAADGNLEAGHGRPRHGLRAGAGLRLAPPAIGNGHLWAAVEGGRHSDVVAREIVGVWSDHGESGVFVMVERSGLWLVIKRRDDRA